MSRGYPDYFGQQGFLKHGSLWLANGDTVNVGAGGSDDIVDLSLKGRIYGGILYFTAVDDPLKVTVQFTVDDHAVSAITLLGLRALGLFLPHSYICFITQYDTVGQIFTVAVTEGITFETSFKITIASIDTEEFSCIPYVYYSRVN